MVLPAFWQKESPDIMPHPKLRVRQLAISHLRCPLLQNLLGLQLRVTKHVSSHKFTFRSCINPLTLLKHMETLHSVIFSRDVLHPATAPASAQLTSSPEKTTCANKLFIVFSNVLKTYYSYYLDVSR